MDHHHGGRECVCVWHPAPAASSPAAACRPVTAALPQLQLSHGYVPHSSHSQSSGCGCGAWLAGRGSLAYSFAAVVAYMLHMPHSHMDTVRTHCLVS